MFELYRPYVAVTETYESHSINHIGMQIIQEADILTMKTLALSTLKTAYETTLLTEDAAKVRAKITEGLQKIIEIIKNLTRKFQQMALSLVGRNRKWLEGVKTKLNESTVKDNYSYTIYPYWRNMSKLLSYRLPEFRDTDQQFLDDLSEESTFKEKHFKDLYITSEGKTTFDPKTYFRGKTEKVKMNKGELLSNLDGMIKFIEDYKKNTDAVIEQNNRLTTVLDRAVSKVKTAPVNEASSFLMETIHMLLEEDKPATTSTVNKEEDKSGEGQGQSTTPNREDGQSSTEGIRNLAESRQIYVKVCYSVNSARMAIMEECYNGYVKALSAALIKKNKSKKEEE